MTYYDGLTDAMTWLGQQENTVFIGQAVEFAGTGMTNSFKHVPDHKKKELPILEELQNGFALGLSLEGFVPISVIPRLNFLLCSINQIVNHIDKYPVMSKYRPKVIIRCGVGSVSPLDPSNQHKGDFTDAIASMCKTIKVKKLMKTEDIIPAYQEAYYADHSTILVEISDFLAEDFKTKYEAGEVEDRFNPFKA